MSFWTFIVALAILVMGEYVVQSRWPAWYFRFGPVVFRRRVHRTGDTVKSLTRRLSGQRVLGADVELAPLGPSDVGFCLEAGFRMLPVLHGQIVVEPASLVVRCRLRWYFVTILGVLLPLLAIVLPEDQAVAIAVAVGIMSVLWLIVDAVRVARFIAILTA